MDLHPLQKRTWAEIDFDRINNNFEIVRNQVGSKVKVCCVIKANAYGHGAVQLAKFYENIGVDFFAVSNIEEALQLRNAGIITPILVLGYTNPNCAVELAKHDISQCVYSKEYGENLSKAAILSGVCVKVHIKIDTGMGRIGFRYLGENLEGLEEAAYVCGLQGFLHEGIFTHFSSADEVGSGEEYTRRQFEYFCYASDYLDNKGFKFQIKHCANSAAIFNYPEMHMDMVRAGIVLYGLLPSESLKNIPDVCPVLKLKSIISHIKVVKSGESISYGREFVAEKDMVVATIPIGYADGILRVSYLNHIFVEVDNQFVPIVGRICMDQCMIDISNVKNAKINSEVTIYGDTAENSIEHIAKINNTISYEILCDIGERVPRVYKMNKKIIHVTDNIV